jgi:hypothetical protein
LGDFAKYLNISCSADILPSAGRMAAIRRASRLLQQRAVQNQHATTARRSPGMP